MPDFKGGYLGRIGRVDLTSRRATDETLSRRLVRDFVGGRGWSSWIAWSEIPENVDPLGPENKLVVATGPLTGLLTIASGKTTFASISPQTGIYGDSNVGGMFGPELKYSGYDALIIEGRAERPTYLLVDEGRIEFKEASHLWGRGSYETEDTIKKDLNDKRVKVASIGPAGENLVKFSCVNVEYGRQAGRTGTGAVMGAKKLKAIAVRGSKDVAVADFEKLRNIFDEAMRIALNHRDLKMWQRQGTLQILDWSNDNDCLPTRNFQAANFEAIAGIDGYAMESKTKVSNKSCFGCPMGCGQFSIVRSGDYKGTAAEGPEYESATLLGSNCGLEKIEEVVHANYLCDDFGLDSISAGNVVAFAMECFERGLLRSEEVQGLDLRFGNAKAMFELLRMVASRSGIGDLLAEGVRTASKKIGKGSEKFAMHSKGLEISGYDSRGAQAMGLSYATCDIGAHHNRSWAITYDLKVGRTTYGDDKVKWVIYLQHIRPMFDCLGVCRLPWLELGIPPEIYVKSYSAATGIDASLDDMLRVSERVWNLNRAIAARRGVSGKDDWLPDRLFDDPVPAGVAKGMALDRGKFSEMVSTYHRLRGWSPTGIPTKEKLAELGLEDVAHALWA
jgi:aldehyde:ferredoxin oxidoreductase